MTWIIGTPSSRGYAAGISDIRVTLADGRTLDWLQKIYAVGRFIAAGFAGSVEFGFGALHDLAANLDGLPADEAWIPGRVAFRWYRRARGLFAQAPERVKRLSSEIMLLGASPNVDIGIPGYARTTVAILRAPTFEPLIVKPNAIESIGSGEGVAPYREELARLNRDRQVFLSEAGMQGGFAYTLMHFIRGTLERHPDRFVSPHVHVCVVRRNDTTLHRSDYTIVENGRQREIRMPPVATSWAEFVAMCENERADATAAIS